MINFSRPAKIAFNTLLPEDRKCITEFINQLEQFPDNNVVYEVKKLAHPDSLYFMKAGNFRIIFQVDGDVIEIVDILQRNRLYKFTNMMD
jgi:mRNA-degrading endonuclease RelE of RelBE toxin-antitoxin system